MHEFCHCEQSEVISFFNAKIAKILFKLLKIFFVRKGISLSKEESFNFLNFIIRRVCHSAGISATNLEIA